MPKPHRGQPAGSQSGTQSRRPSQTARKPVPRVSNAKHASPPAGDVEHKKLPAGEGIRLQKVLAQAGVASRRAAEEMIDEGRVEVDGLIVREQGLRIDPKKAVVRVDGARIMVTEDLVHLVLNKPVGMHSTMSDDQGRPCVGDLVSERIAAGQRLFHVGRLDVETEGLLILTNDGDLAHRLMHPSYEIAKTYLATVKGEIKRPAIRDLKQGVELEDGPAKADRVTVVELHENKSLLRIQLHEGRNRIVRRMLDAVGYPVMRLVRTHLGPVALGDQRPGSLRALSRGEVAKLYEAVGL